MIAVAFDRAAAQAGAAAQPEAIIEKLVLHSEHAQALRHGGQPVALLDAQLHRPPHQRFSFRDGRRDEEHRKLVDGERHQGFRHANALQPALAHLDVGDRLAAGARLLPQPHAPEYPLP